METEANLIKETQTLHSDMQTLVYENYNKFISATDTIRKMKVDFNKMEGDMNLLTSKISDISCFSGQVSQTLEDTRKRLSRLSEKHSFLKRLQFLSTLPLKLRAHMKTKNFSQAVNDYVQAEKVLQHYGNHSSFQGIYEECRLIVQQLKQSLRNDFQFPENASSHCLTEIGGLLLLLGEEPADLAQEMLQSTTKRLNDHVAVLQDQTERDMIEFVDFGINGFLSDLILVATSYRELFLSKTFDSISEDFQENACAEIRDFILKNLEIYLSLIRDRVETDINNGDTKILVRGLDKLHRRLMTMENICCVAGIRKAAIVIIANSAYKLCNLHLRSLKTNFSDNLNSARLSLVTAGSLRTVELNELISQLYISTTEKVKDVLLDISIYLNNDWSFNIETDFTGYLCIADIRENVLIGFLRHMTIVMSCFTDLRSCKSPNFLLILSKFCLQMEEFGVHSLINLVDELYEIDSKNNASLTHEFEISSEMKESGKVLINSYVHCQGLHISQMLRRSVETRDWLNCLEPRSVRAVMKRVIDELSSIELSLESLYNADTNKTPDSDSSRKTHLSNMATSKLMYRSNWSNYTPVHLESPYSANIHRLFLERVEIFTSVEFTKNSIMAGTINIALKTLLESTRLRTFSKNGLQQTQVDLHYLQVNLWRFVSDENLLNFLLNEILGSAVHRCLEPILMEPNAVELISERG